MQFTRRYPEQLHLKRLQLIVSKRTHMLNRHTSLPAGAASSYPFQIRAWLCFVCILLPDEQRLGGIPARRAPLRYRAPLSRQFRCSAFILHNQHVIATAHCIWDVCIFGVCCLLLGISAPSPAVCSTGEVRTRGVDVVPDVRECTKAANNNVLPPNEPWATFNLRA